MTMLMHTQGPIDRTPSRPIKHDTAEAEPWRARLVMVRRFCISTLGVIAAGCALIAAMALKVIFYVPHAHFG